MPASAAIPGLFCCFAATVLLVFVSVSTPTWNSVYFLHAGVGSSATRFGVFGSTGSSITIGYKFEAAGFNSSSLNTSVIYNLTKTLILHPIAAGLAGLAFLFGLCGAGYHRAGTVFMSLLAALATLVTLVAWVIDMVLFGIARNNFRDQNFDSQYGNACWLTLGALIALLLAFCASACGVFGNYRKRRETF
ncbi:pali-domain-containing protein [Desarmillaria tabescens]|uniref:Pali-domain-containing protein n=1 Tax=Armillaria tabescens TaxID=1929756 RepID=A0AA39MWF0_ARMTA|nr:pali-domain-containing protein [Desarmillaria tabescens]KAK0448340.1 pali-domain-containing protein [Desarmillaria tabescens]